MSKRQSEDNLPHCSKRKKKLESKNQLASRRRRIIYSDSESDFETNEEIETLNNDASMEISPIAYDGLEATENISFNDIGLPQVTSPSPPDDTQTEVSPTTNECTTLEHSSGTQINADPKTSSDAISELDPDILLALGDPAEDIPVFGENIHTDIAQRWLPILRKGLTKEVKAKLLKEHNVPDNCRLLKAPSLNPEIAAAVADVVRVRDKKIEIKQGQLGLGITAVSKAMSALINDGKKVEVIKLLSEGCRILTDLHYTETQIRTNLITPCLDKSFFTIIQNEERDDTLFGNKLSEKIKAAKSIEKQGLQIKRKIPNATKFAPQQQIARFRQPGNGTNPPRYPSSANKGGRGGMYSVSRQASGSTYRRFQSPASSAQPPPQAQQPPQAPPQARQQAASRSRAPMRQ